MLIRLIICLFVALSFTSCATISTTMSPEAQSRLTEANFTTDSLQDEFRRIYSDIGEAAERIVMLYALPGWAEMEQIIRSTVSDEENGTEATIEVDITAAIDAWSQKWNSPGEEVYTDYLSLVERCTFIEVRRLALRLRLRSAEVKLVHALAIEVAAGRTSQQEIIERSIEELETLEAQINAYTINDLGLYDPAGSGKSLERNIKVGNSRNKDYSVLSERWVGMEPPFAHQS